MFRSSSRYRKLVISNLDRMVKLTTEMKLLQPEKAALELKRTALKTLNEWKNEFGETHIKLKIACDYLSRVKKIDFNTLETVDPATSSRQQENARRLEAINKVRIKKTLAEIKDKEEDFKTTVTSLSNSINLLLPHPDDFFIVAEGESEPVPPTLQDLDSGSENDDDPQASERREVGIHSAHHSVQFHFVPSSEVCIEETSENTDIIESTRENAKLIKNKYLPTVKAWLEVLSKSAGHSGLKNSLTELRGDMEDLLFKFSRMLFTSEADVSSDSDLEEVPEPEPPPKQPRVLEPADWTLGSSAGGSSKESTPVKCVAGLSDRKQKLLAVAPKLPFDVDLYHWEDEKLPVPTLISNSTEGHRFWVSSDSNLEQVPVPEGSASLRTRVLEFTGTFTPVTHSCRVPLPSGKLCPRRDRIKCPFHGEIVPRDEKGNCLNPKDTIRLQALAEKRQQEKPDWQDPKLLAEIKKSTGLDLKMPEKGKRKKIKKYPGLTDLKPNEDTATKRLEKKLFKKSAMKRVATVLDKIDQKKFTDKFGDQFNYFYQS